MPHRVPPPPPKGTRHPGAGRKRGTPNKITVEARTLVSQLVADPNYQQHLRTAFRRRKLHPTIESLIWQFHIGKPVAAVQIRGSMEVDVTARLAEERTIFAQLDIAQLEQLAAESEALVAKARAWTAEKPALGPIPSGVTDPTHQRPTDASVSEELLGKVSGSDNGDYVKLVPNLDSNDGTPDPPAS